MKIDKYISTFLNALFSTGQITANLAGKATGILHDSMLIAAEEYAGCAPMFDVDGLALLREYTQRNPEVYQAAKVRVQNRVDAFNRSIIVTGTHAAGPFLEEFTTASGPRKTEIMSKLLHPLETARVVAKNLRETGTILMPKTFANRVKGETVPKDFEPLTPQQVIAGRENGTFLYVVTTDRRLLLARDFGPSRTVHSFVANLGLVLVAGEAEIRNGKVKSLNDDSGHYMTEGPQLQPLAEYFFIKNGFPSARGTFRYNHMDYHPFICSRAEPHITSVARMEWGQFLFSAELESKLLALATRKAETKYEEDYESGVVIGMKIMRTFIASYLSSHGCEPAAGDMEESYELTADASMALRSGISAGMNNELMQSLIKLSPAQFEKARTLILRIIPRLQELAKPANLVGRIEFKPEKFATPDEEVGVRRPVRMASASAAAATAGVHVAGPTVKQDFRKLWLEWDRKIFNLICGKLPAHDDLAKPQTPQITQKYQVNIKDCGADGDCLFRAIAEQVPSCGMGNHGRLRERAVAAIRAGVIPREYLPTDIAEYTAEMSQLGAWGGEIEIYTLSESLQQPIVVFDRRNPLPLVYNRERATTASPIFLYYNGSTHYQAAVPVNGDARTLLSRVLVETTPVTQQSRVRFTGS
ncbi:MAG: hypothetical protein KBD25_00840 [Rickettsiaceae bacterium]|nr:hypothetical protein [Rickettsiaceae bacterium]